MLQWLKSLLSDAGDDLLCVQAYWCDTSIKLPAKVSTPLGGKVTVITACVDIYYAVHDDRVDVRRVKLSREGGRIMGSRQATNVAATHRGEAWYADSICPEADLRAAVVQDLDQDHSRLRRIMMGKSREANA